MALLTISESADSYIQFMTVLILFVLVLAITYYATRWMAGYQKSRVSGSNIEVVETMSLAGNKYLQIIRVGQKYLAVAICKDTVTMLTEIPEQDLIISGVDEPKALGFKDVLEKIQKKNFLEKKDGRDE